MDACKFDIFNAKAVGAYAILWNAGEYGAHYLLFIICGGRSIELIYENNEIFNVIGH